MDILSMLSGVVIAIVIGALALIVRPWRARLAEFGRKMFEREPVIVTFETDLDVIYAGYPDWIGQRSYLPQLPSSAPPITRGGWQTWVSQSGGHDLGLATLGITVVARSESTVLFRPPVIECVARLDLESGGVGVVRPVGGASVYPLGFDVRLDSHPEVVRLVGTEEELRLPHVWTITPSEPLVLLLRIMVNEPGLWRWRAHLPLEVDGRKLRIDICPDDEDAFTIVGNDTPPDEFVWDGQGWVPVGGVT